MISPDIPNLRRGIPLSELDGLTIWHETRVEEEDIENIANMADADIVDLMLNTKLPPHRIVEWVDQAILYRYILWSQATSNADSDDAKLRQLLNSNGIRTASCLIMAAQEKAGQQGSPLQNMGDAAQQKKLLNLICAMHTHPNLAPIMRWKGIGNKMLNEAPPLGTA